MKLQNAISDDVGIETDLRVERLQPLAAYDFHLLILINILYNIYYYYFPTGYGHTY